MKNKLILQTQQRFKSESHNVFTKKMYEIAASSNNYQKTQSTDTIEICIYGMSKDLVSEKEEIKCKSIIKRYKKSSILIMLQKKPRKEHDINWPQIPNHSYRILITGGSASGKTN